MAGSTYVADLSEGSVVDATFAVQRKTRRTTRNGDPFLSVELADRTGRVAGVVWKDVNLLGARFDQGDTIRVLGKVEQYAGRLQISVRDVERIEGGGDPLELVPGSRRDAETLEGFLEFLTGEIHHDGLRALVNGVLGDPRTRERLRNAPASESHHDYAGGLLEHTVAVATLCREAAQLHPKLNSDILLAAALLHDIGRTETFRPGVTIAVSDEGRMLGHVLAGVRMIDAAARASGLADDVLLPLLNAVAGHHGPLEGRRLETAEAVALHHANTLDARLGESLGG
ncbi:MAG TPA: HD domain-containing protein [Gaiellales bacterium]|jgi:3'-5' exoribonuclease|nr:HD domain-containing protein [Gaiellales bacterium]